MSQPDYNEPIDGEICGIPLEAYALGCQLLYDDKYISEREYRQICSYVELPPDSAQFKIGVPKIVNAACRRWLKAHPGELGEEDAEMKVLVERLKKATDEEIRRAVS